MWYVRVAGMMTMAFVISGCAGGRTRQDLARLQSQMGMFDERLTQLERTNFGGSPAVSLDESAGGTGSAGVVSAGSGKRTTAAARSTANGAKSSAKPSTKEVQQALKNAGFYQGAVDGKMGPVTRDAVKEFQRIHGLKDDGVVGRQTWAKLASYAGLSSASGDASLK